MTLTKRNDQLFKVFSTLCIQSRTGEVREDDKSKSLRQGYQQLGLHQLICCNRLAWASKMSIVKLLIWSNVLNVPIINPKAPSLMSQLTLISLKWQRWDWTWTVAGVISKRLADLGMVRFGSVWFFNGFWRTLNRTIGSVHWLCRTLDRTVGSVQNGQVLVLKWSKPWTGPKYINWQKTNLLFVNWVNTQVVLYG